MSLSLRSFLFVSVLVLVLLSLTVRAQLNGTLGACEPAFRPQTATAAASCQWQAGPPSRELQEQWNFRCEASSVAAPSCWTIGFGANANNKFCCLGVQPDGTSCRLPDGETCGAKGQCASDSCSHNAVCCAAACDDDDCTADGQCLLRNSKTCSTGQQCFSSLCSADGYCCSAQCSGAQQTCASGTCLTLLGGECTTNAQCQSGFCSGDGRCCSSACGNATQSTCSSGDCKTRLQMTCAVNTDCASGFCSGDGFCCSSDCPSGFGTCASGTCRLSLRAVCNAGSQCASGHCSRDGYCCSQNCPGAAESCRTGECLGGLASTCADGGDCSTGFCSGDGFCCATPCAGVNATCAKGACLRRLGTTCTLGAECVAGWCSADGYCCNSACANATTSTCALGTCLVRNSRRCAYDDNCASGHCSDDDYCCDTECQGPDRTCVQGRCLIRDASVCSADADCNSGFCSADGFCCSEACPGADTSTCASGECRLRPGQPCVDNAQCWSDFCSADGFCCQEACLGADGINVTCASGSCCGDRLLSPLPPDGAAKEGCDDGNLENDDGCLSSCAVDDGWLCVYNSTLSPAEYQNISYCFKCPPDQREDRDNDGFPRCIDECENNPQMAFEGDCGCFDCDAQRSGKGSGSNSSLLIALPVAISALALLLCLLCCLLLICVVVGCLLARRRRNKWDPYIDDVVVFWDEPLGRGAYGSVFYAQLRGGARVAAKRVHRDELPDIEREARNLAQIENPNVVKVYGLYRAKRLGASSSSSDDSADTASERPLPVGIAADDETGTATYIILEPVGDGVTLQQVAPHLSLADVVEVLQGVAAGMSALYNARLLHRDLSARNVLCERVTTRSGSMQHRVKIADFGHTIQMPRGRDEVQESATAIAMAWTAPEGFQGRWRLASDVWSFGVLLWEMANHGADPTGVAPYSSAERGEIYRHLEQHGSPLAIDGASEAQRRLHALLRECLELDPDARPTWDSISASLEATRVAVADTDRRKPNALPGPVSIVAKPLGAVDLSQMANPTSHAYDQG